VSAPSSAPGGSRRYWAAWRLGGVTGGLLGALTNAGISEEGRAGLVEGVRRGGTLVTTRVPRAIVPRVEAINETSRGKPRGTLRPLSQVLAGNRFDPNAMPYTRRPGSCVNARFMLASRLCLPSRRGWPRNDDGSSISGLGLQPRIYFRCEAPLAIGREFSEIAVILEQLMLGITVVAVVLLLLPFLLLVMAGVGAACCSGSQRPPLCWLLGFLAGVSR